MCCTIQMPTATATNWRNDVAMGVSPWSRNHRRHASPEGTTGIVAPPIHVAPLGLRDRFNLPVHGFAPVATISRPFGTNVHAPGRHVGAKETGHERHHAPCNKHGLVTDQVQQDGSSNSSGLVVLGTLEFTLTTANVICVVSSGELHSKENTEAQRHGVLLRAFPL